MLKEVILATGAFYIDSNLKGILTPSLSYLVSIPFNVDNLPMENREKYKKGVFRKNSPNYINLDNIYDWSIVNNYMRISGED